jgi:TRAP-type C4-dicarboxylate transport system substrate-binding protein
MVLTHHVPAVAGVVKNVFKPAMRRLEKMSNGKIKVTENWGGTVHSAREGSEATRSGLSDYAPCFSAYSAKDFTLVHAHTLPGLFPTADVAVIATEELYPKWFRSEFERIGNSVSRMGAGSGYHIFSNKPVRTLQDAKGLKIRAAGGLHAKANEALGFVPITMPAAEMYPAMQRGLIDAVSLNDAAGAIFKAHELAKYRTHNNMTRLMLEYCVGPKWFADLPGDLQRVYNSWSRQHGQVEAQFFYELGGILAQEKFKKAGMQFIELTDDETARWEASLAAMAEEWIAGQEAAGRPARQLVGELQAASKKYAAMTANQRLQETIDNPIMGMYSFK